MSSEETRKFLEFQPPGTFLVRFSSSKPGSFALGFTSTNKKVTNVMINTIPKGFSIMEQNQEKVFSNLKEIIAYYGSVLINPFDSILPEEP